jgi:hypothetical protein
MWSHPRSALWLGVLNPLVPLQLVAGTHNDALMLGLLAAGLHLALGQSPRHRLSVLATVLVTLAALIKSPAAAGLLVVAARWRSARRVGAVAASVTVSFTFLAVPDTAGFPVGSAFSVANPRLE